MIPKPLVGTLHPPISKLPIIRVCPKSNPLPKVGAFAVELVHLPTAQAAFGNLPTWPVRHDKPTLLRGDSSLELTPKNIACGVTPGLATIILLALLILIGRRVPVNRRRNRTPVVVTVPTRLCTRPNLTLETTRGAGCRNFWAGKQQAILSAVFRTLLQLGSFLRLLLNPFLKFAVSSLRPKLMVPDKWKWPTTFVPKAVVPARGCEQERV